VGLTYVDAARWRSQALVEYGPPQRVPAELVELHKTDAAAARAALLEDITQALRAVCVTAPSYRELKIIHMTRRLLRPVRFQGQASQYTTLHKFFAEAHAAMRDDAAYRDLQANIEAYMTKLKAYGLTDRDVASASASSAGGGRARRGSGVAVQILRLLRIALTVLVFAPLALPCAVTVVPIRLILHPIVEEKTREAVANSSVKIKGDDVRASLKVVYGTGLVVAVHVLWALVAVVAFEACGWGAMHDALGFDGSSAEAGLLHAALFFAALVVVPTYNFYAILLLTFLHRQLRVAKALAFCLLRYGNEGLGARIGRPQKVTPAATTGGEGGGEASPRTVGDVSHLDVFGMRSVLKERTRELFFAQAPKLGPAFADAMKWLHVDENGSRQSSFQGEVK